MTNVNFFFKVGHRSRSRVIFFCMSGKLLSQEIYMPNIKALSEMVQKLLGQGHFFKVGQNDLYEWAALVTRNLYAKNEGSLKRFKSYDQCYFFL